MGTSQAGALCRCDLQADFIAYRASYFGLELQNAAQLAVVLGSPYMALIAHLDELCSNATRPPFWIMSWRLGDVVQQGDTRQKYLQDLRTADEGDIVPILNFARSRSSRSEVKASSKFDRENDQFAVIVRPHPLFL